MALDKAVDSAQLNADLTAVADAIRTKGGTSAQLAFPDGFVSAVQAIEGAPDLQIVVTTSAGATVTATKGSKTVSGTADASGNCTLTVDEAGMWSVVATLGAQSATAGVLVGESSVSLSLYAAAFADNDWATIIKACHKGEVPETWLVGNSKNMTINKTSYRIDIIGKNHDDYADGSGKAPLTFQLHACYAQSKSMNNSDTNSGGWKNSVMRQTHLPAILALMPSDVQNGIRAVNKVTEGTTTADKLFLLSEPEIFGSTTYSTGKAGTQYDYYKAGNSAAKTQNNGQSQWWERSKRDSNSNQFCCVQTSGTPTYNSAGNPSGFSYGFCF